MKKAYLLKQPRPRPLSAKCRKMSNADTAPQKLATVDAQSSDATDQRSLVTANVDNDAAKNALLKTIGGSDVNSFNSTMFRETIATVWMPDSDVNGREARIPATLAALKAFKPKDEIEGMLAAQPFRCTSARWSA